MKYITSESENEKRDYAHKIKKLTGYDGIYDFSIVEESTELDKDIGNITNEAIDSIVNRLVPGTSHSDFPEMILRDYTFSDSDNLSCKCEEILQSRKTEQYGRLYDYDCSYVISVPEGMPPLYWYMCMLMDILRDCQLLMSLILRDGCRDHCSIMNASSDFEYMCSCHTQTQKCSALDYYYHNINYSIIRLGAIQLSVEEKTQDSGSIMKDIATVLRRLYRLYLHAYYQHFSVFGEVELQQHLYERFYRFVTTNRLLSEKDMKPFLSLDEVFAVIYNAM